MRKVLRSIYLDQEIDEALAARAEQEKTTKAELMRDYISSGLERPSRIHPRRHGIVDENQDHVRVGRRP